MYVIIDHIISSCPHGDAVTVYCQVERSGGFYEVRIDVSASTVSVVNVQPVGHVDAIDVSRVEVSPDLIKATRRLFSLVGDA